MGLRDACDIDVLLSVHDAPRLHSTLKDRGFREKTPTHPQFHYPMLIDDSGGAVEIHTSLPHVRFGSNEREVTFDQLVETNRVTSAADLSDRAHVPIPEVLLAHAIGHGIAQHGFLPQSYPLFRLVADAIDLDIVGNRERMAQALSWVQPDVSKQEVLALQKLATLLTMGSVETAWMDNGPVGRVLRHMVYGSLDDRYCSGLKVYQALHVLLTAGFSEFLREYGHATFALPDEDVSRIYGAAAHGREAHFKSMRPLDVLARVLRMLPDAAVIARRQLVTIVMQRVQPGNGR